MTGLRFCGVLTAALAGVLSGTLTGAAHAQVLSNITADGTLPTPTTVTPGGAEFVIGGGTVRGPNQFHSFGQFSVGTGDAARFTGPAAIQNIVSRVTGGVGSQIDGALISDILGANLFLMNPAGIMFGPNAQLFVDGAFHATTANYMRFGDDIFHSDPAQGTAFNGSNFTVAPPSAFGFTTSNPAAIEVVGSFLVGQQEKTMSFVGGPVSIGAPDTPSYVVAPAGRINLISVASPGEATFDGAGFNVSGFAQLGDIRIQGSAGVDPETGRQFGSVVDGKEVFIRGGQLVISEGVILPGASSLPPFCFEGLCAGPPPDGGEVNIDVRGAVTITGTAAEFFTQAPPGIVVFNGFFDSNFMPGFDPSQSPKVPDITINAGSMSMSGFASVQTNRFGPGDPPKVTINANSLTVESGAGVGLFNSFEGPGGQLTVTAPQVTLSGGGVTGAAAAVGATGLLAQGLFHPLYTGGLSLDPALTLAESGTITINAAQSLTMKGGAQITTDSRNLGASKDITINAGDMMLSDSGSVIAAQSLFAGDSGNVTINATGQVTIDNGFVISANTFGSGNSGNITVNAGKGITITGTASGIASQTGSPPEGELDAFAQAVLADPDATFANLVGFLGLDPATATILDVLGPLAGDPFGFGPLIPPVKTTPGNAGTISVTAPSIIVSGQNSAIDSGTAWGIKAQDGTVFGNAGAVEVSGGTVTVSGGGEIRSRSGILDLVSGNLDVGAGNAGTVTVSANDTLTVTGVNSAISTSTFGDGKGGDVRLNAGNRVTVVDGGRVSAESGGFVGGAVAVGAGSGGSVVITAGSTITVSDPGSQVSTTTFGDGAGGAVALTANQVDVQNGGQVTSDSGGLLGGVLVVGSGSAGTVTINATGANTLTISGADSGVSTTTLGAGDGGDIILTSAGDVMILDGGSVSADSLGGAGLTGTIDIAAGDSIIMENGTISTRAITSDGGNIKLTAPNIVHLEGAQITTSVESGVGGGGNINIDPQFVLVNNSSIIANAFGGPGGNITIIANNFLQSATSIIEASSALSTPGVIEVRSPENNVENNIAQLPAAFIDASALLRGLCTARRTGAPSSFTVAGRGGVPVDADGYLPAFGSDVAAAVAGSTGEPQLVFALLANTLDCAR
jgi:filamentous hemagglutinin family protein